MADINVTPYLAIADTYHDFLGSRCPNFSTKEKIADKMLLEKYNYKFKSNSYYPEDTVINELIKSYPQAYNFEDAYDVTDIIDESDIQKFPQIKFLKYITTSEKLNKSKFTAAMRANFGSLGVIVDVAPKQPFEFTNPDVEITDQEYTYNIISICSFWDAASRSVKDGKYITTKDEWNTYVGFSDPEPGPGPKTIPISATPFHFIIDDNDTSIKLNPAETAQTSEAAQTPFFYILDEKNPIYKFPLSLQTLPPIKGVLDLCTSVKSDKLGSWQNVFNIKRSQDYGQVHFAKALNDAGKTCFLQTHDRLCFMKALELNIPAIFFRNNISSGNKTFYIHVGTSKFKSENTVELQEELSTLLSNEVNSLSSSQKYILNNQFNKYKASNTNKDTQNTLLVLEALSYIEEESKKIYLINPPTSLAGDNDYNDIVNLAITKWDNLSYKAKFHVHNYNHLLDAKKKKIYNLIDNKNDIDILKSIPIFDGAMFLGLNLENYDVSSVKTFNYNKFAESFMNAIKNIESGSFKSSLKIGYELTNRIKNKKKHLQNLLKIHARDEKKKLQNLLKIPEKKQLQNDENNDKFKLKILALDAAIQELENKRSISIPSDLMSALVIEQGEAGVVSITNVRSKILQEYEQDKEASVNAFRKLLDVVAEAEAVAALQAQMAEQQAAAVAAEAVEALQAQMADVQAATQPKRTRVDEHALPAQPAPKMQKKEGGGDPDPINYGELDLPNFGDRAKELDHIYLFSNIDTLIQDAKNWNDLEYYMFVTLSKTLNSFAGDDKTNAIILGNFINGFIKSFEVPEDVVVEDVVVEYVSPSLATNIIPIKVGGAQGRPSHRLASKEKIREMLLIKFLSRHKL
jgi:hypothetical protein